MAWLQLTRISNLPSALANILMGFLLAHGSWQPTWELVCLMLASTGFYLGGMVLNDVFDIDIDREQRPGRPLPSGRIRLDVARRIGFGLLLFGWLNCLLAGWLTSGAAVDFRPVGIGGLLAICVLLYDGPLKRSWVAPMLMGACRTLNVLLGASTVVLAAGEAQPWNLGMPAICWWIACSVGVLVAGATLLGRKEAVARQSRAPLVLATFLVGLGIAGIAAVVTCPVQPALSEQASNRFPLFIALIGLVIMRRVVTAAWLAKPKAIQMGVVSVLRSLIVLDASVCYLVAPEQPWFAFVVLALLIPSLLLGRAIRQT